MDYFVLSKIKENPQMYEYLKENSEWVKYFNRNPRIFKEYTKYIKEKYKLRTTDKIATAIDDIDLVVNVLNTLK